MTEREQFDGTECEECIEREATEFFEDGSQLCGPCTIKFAHDRLTPKGRAALRAPASEGEAVAWRPSGAEYDRSIHHNPDAKAWADLFVQTYPDFAHEHDTMLGWFANAMMAMHDHLVNKLPTHPAPATVTEACALRVDAYHSGEKGESITVRFRNAVDANAFLTAIVGGKQPETSDVTTAARALVEKLNEVHADPRYVGVWTMAAVRGAAYNGPTYEAELAALTAAIGGAR